MKSKVIIALSFAMLLLSCGKDSDGEEERSGNSVSSEMLVGDWKKVADYQAGVWNRASASWHDSHFVFSSDGSFTYADDRKSGTSSSDYSGTYTASVYGDRMSVRLVYKKGSDYDTEHTYTAYFEDGGLVLEYDSSTKGLYEKQ